MNLIDMPVISPPAPGTPCGYLIITADGSRQLVLDHARAVEIAGWKHGQVYPVGVLADSQRDRADDYHGLTAG